MIWATCHPQSFQRPLNLFRVELPTAWLLGVNMHRAVYEKIAKGDPVAARQAVRRLMLCTRNHVKATLNMVRE